MSGAGSFGAGLGPAGFDEIADPSAPRSVTVPRAIQIDGVTADYLTDDDGRYIDSHPVDQAVALALIIRAGTFGADSTAGHRLREVTRIGNEKAVSQVEDFVALALANLISRGDITVLKIETDTGTRGQLRVAVTYKNNRTRSTETKAVQLN